MENAIGEMELSDLGRFIAARTGDLDAAAIAHSSAPQVRYNAVVTARVSSPSWRDAFTDDELRALVARVTEPIQEELLMKLNLA